MYKIYQGLFDVYVTWAEGWCDLATYCHASFVRHPASFLNFHHFEILLKNCCPISTNIGLKVPWHMAFKMFVHMTKPGPLGCVGGPFVTNNRPYPKFSSHSRSGRALWYGMYIPREELIILCSCRVFRGTERVAPTWQILDHISLSNISIANTNWYKHHVIHIYR